MYLVHLPDDHPVRWLFVHADPRRGGCPFPIEGPVAFADEACLAAAGPNGENLRRFVLGRSVAWPAAYKRFVLNGARIEPEYQRLDGTAMALPTWEVYGRIRQRSAAVSVATRAAVK